MTDTSNASALTLIETKTPVEIFSNNGLNPLLDAIKKEVDSFIPDISSKRGRDEIKSFAHKIARSKTALDKLGADLVSDWKAQSKKVDLERSRAWDFLEGLQKQIRKPLDDFEAKEAQRVAKHEANLRGLEAFLTPQHGIACFELRGDLELLEAIIVDDSWEEFKDRATSLKAKGVEALEKAINERITFEKEQAELLKLREEKAAREKKEHEERIAKEAAAKAKKEAEEKAQKDAEEAERIKQQEILFEKQRAEKIEQEKQEAITRQKKAEEDARAAKELAEKQKKESEERAKAVAIKAEQDKKAAEEKAREDERLRIQKEQEKEAQEKAKREANLKHRKTINNEILNALLIVCGLTDAQAKLVIESIVKGQVPHTKIEY